MFLWFMLAVMCYVWYAYRKHLRDEMYAKKQVIAQKRMLNATYAHYNRNYLNF